MNHERKIILKSLYAATKQTDQDELMNWLQERGLVSDNCIKLEEVPTTDLFRAMNKISTRNKN
jgi:hypothetical protein